MIGRHFEQANPSAVIESINRKHIKLSTATNVVNYMLKRIGLRVLKLIYRDTDRNIIYKDKPVNINTAVNTSI